MMENSVFPCIHVLFDIEMARLVCTLPCHCDNSTSKILYRKSAFSCWCRSSNCNLEQLV